MFERFLGQFRVLPEGQERAPEWRDDMLLGVAGYEQLMRDHAGLTFENGLYRLHSADSGPRLQELASEAYPEFDDQFRVFGFDWLGRQFAVDFRRQENDRYLVLMLEPGTAEALEIPVDFERFHDEELVDYRDAALAVDFFNEWAQANPAAMPLAHGDCVGYETPLFLGGEDDLDNLEVIDVEVYWSILGQLRPRLFESAEGDTVQVAPPDPT